MVELLSAAAKYDQYLVLAVHTLRLFQVMSLLNCADSEGKIGQCYTH